MTIRWEAAGATDVGRVRRGNEDAFLVDAERGVFLVADGMGGHAAGEVASALAAAAAGGVLGEAAAEWRGGGEPPLERAFHAAWTEITECCRSDPRTAGMGTTLTVCAVRPDGSCVIGHIGDSRAYRLRETELTPLTRDHTWVQREVDAGRLHAAAAESHPLAHILTRVLSSDLPPDPDVVTADLRPGDLLLLSSDGMHGLVSDAEIRRAALPDLAVDAVPAALIRLANARGGRDNITVVAVRVLAEGAPSGA